MQIAHFSDLHGNLACLRDIKGPGPDMWISTGDILPNTTRGDRAIEIPYQEAWLSENFRLFEEVFGYHTPILIVDGNHDYADFQGYLARNDFNAHRVEQNPQYLMGKWFAGFPNIPYIQGEWNHETDHADMTALVDKVLGNKIDFLITHAPPNGIMDSQGYGVPAITSQLFYRPECAGVKAHFFGHTHGCRGTREENGILFSNAACGLNLVELSDER